MMEISIDAMQQNDKSKKVMEILSLVQCNKMTNQRAVHPDIQTF
jgi:hypothetical protein